MKSNDDVFKKLELIARQVRGNVVSLSHRAETPHLGSSLSCVDLLVSLYGSYLSIDPAASTSPTRDRMILSKGHAAMALYSVLAAFNFFPASQLETFNKDGTSLPEQPAPSCAPGVEWATGSLGHGLSVGVGKAYAAKLRKEAWKTVVLLSDGECNEGSVWEAALLAPRHGLNNLTLIVDFNKWQATARSEETMSLAPLAQKFLSFGWESVEVDGHSIQEILSALEQPSPSPKAIVAHTIKGKGVSFMEDDNNWHYRIPSADEVTKAYQELGLP